MSIASNIKRLREDHGLTQAQFGAIAGVTDKAVSTWESGIKEPRMGAVQKLCDYFGISKGDILLDEQDISLLGSAPKEKPAQADELTPDERAMLAAIRALPDAKRQALLALLGIE